jgi:hypothetical protein
MRLKQLWVWRQAAPPPPNRHDRLRTPGSGAGVPDRAPGADEIAGAKILDPSGVERNYRPFFEGQFGAHISAYVDYYVSAAQLVAQDET